MKTRQTNKLDAYHATLAALDDRPVTAQVPGLAAKIEALRARIGEIHELAQLQTQPIRAGTARRDTVFQALSDRVLEMAGVVMIAGRDRELVDVVATVRFPPSALRRGRRERRIWLARRVLETAQTVLPDLVDYGVTAESLAGFEALIEQARACMHLPRATVAEKSAATTLLAEAFRRMDAFLADEMDRLVFFLREHAEFYARYRASREVVHRRGGRSRAIKHAEEGVEIGAFAKPVAA